MSLKNKLIKLAHDNPELRPHLLPLLKKARGAMDLKVLTSQQIRQLVGFDSKTVLGQGIKREEEALKAIASEMRGRARGITYSGEFGVIERGTDVLYGNNVPALYLVDFAFGNADEGYPVHHLDQREAADKVKQKGGFNTWRKPSEDGFFWSKRKNNIVYNLGQAS